MSRRGRLQEGRESVELELRKGQERASSSHRASCLHVRWLPLSSAQQQQQQHPGQQQDFLGERDQERYS